MTPSSPHDHLATVGRAITDTVRDGVAMRRLSATRLYPAPPADVWDALTDPARIPRWLMPVSGDLRLGGRYQLEGNAGGEVLVCEPAARLSVTWEYGGHVSWVEVLLHESDGATLLELHHDDPLAPETLAFGPGAVGIGWELMLMGLAGHLSPGTAIAPSEAPAWLGSADGVTFVTASNVAWRDVAITAGDDPREAGAAAERCLAAWTG
jgi:uncharacterized protein YndB with AHSA1/START domain